MKRILLILLIITMVTASVSAAVDIPKIEPYVNDFAGLLTPEEELQLNILADTIEVNTTFEIAIVTIDGTRGQNRVEFANEIGDLNGVGKKDLDNGVVVMWSTGDDFGGAIATGRGSESFLTDATVGIIGRDSRSYFDKGEYAAAFNYILTELNKEIINHQTVPIEVTTGKDIGDDVLWIIFGFVGVFIFIIVVSISLADDDSKPNKGYYRDQVYKRHGKWYNPEADRSYKTAAAASAALALMSNNNDDSDSDSSDSDDDSSSSGSFSGGSFGGGSFGGGGAGF